jgi:hypothetical protein
MRMNRGTIILVAVLVVAVVLLLILNNNQAVAPGTSTPAPTNAPVALLPGVDQDTLARLEVRDNTTGVRIVLTKADADSPWLYDDNNPGLAQDLTASQPGPGGETAGQVAAAGTSTGEADPTQVSTLIGLLSNLQGSDAFSAENLGDFGLQNPQYTVLATTYDGAVFLLHVGAQSRVNPRYYVIVEQPGRVELDEDATDEPQAIGTSVMGADQQVGGTGQGNSEGTTLGTAEADAVITNPTQAEIVGENIEATNAAVGTQVAQANATAEAAATQPADDDDQAIATEIAQPDEQTGIGSNTEGTTLEDVTPEASAEATLELTPDVSAPAVNPTLAPLTEPLVNLNGSFTIYLVQKTTLDRFISLIAAPPVLLATPTPAGTALSTDGTDEPLVEPAQDVLVTPEATAEATETP